MYFDQPEKKEEKSLNEPLLESDEEPGARSGKSELSRTSSTASASNGKIPHYTDYMAGRIYASNQPKIVLETISARTATLIIALTYFVFFLGFGIDLYTTYLSFNSNDIQLSAESCESQNATVVAGNENWACTDGYTWKSRIIHLENVISVKLLTRQNNLTEILSTANSTFDVVYDYKLYCCYDAGGCGNNFAPDDSYSNDPGLWQEVLIKYNETVTLSKDDVEENSDGEGITVALIPSTFQNQEAIPTNGLVKAYFIQVEYIEDPYHLFSATEEGTEQYTYYFFDVVERPKQPAINAINIVLMILTMGVLGGYSYLLWNEKKVLSEQKWVLYYFGLLILFQNPVYSVIVWMDSPTVSSAYTSYIIGYLAQAGLFILWLLFADSINRKTLKRLLFYGPKVFIGVFIFTIGVVILTFQFPSVDPTNDRSAVEAVANWSHSLKLSFITFTIMYLVLIWIWTFYWFGHLYFTGKKLNKLPYMSTRYIQLSYRFFLLQATLVTVYYVFQYAAVIYFISSGVNSAKTDATTISDNINILFRQQTQLFGKILFLTIYAFIIAFMFLPAHLLQGSALKASLAATYVITEAEHDTDVRARRATIKKMKRNLLNQVTLMNQIVHAKADVFCVDTALFLRSIAFQSYYDPPGLETASSYDGAMNLEKIGFTLINMHYNKDQEVICFIAREKSTQRIVVSFRGTASKRQMEINLKYQQMPVDFAALDTTSLDQLDGLDFKVNKDDPDDGGFDIESVSEDDWLNEDEETLDEDDISLDEFGQPGRHHSRNSHTSHDGDVGSPQRKPPQEEEHNFRETVVEKANQVRGGIESLLHGAVDVTSDGISKVVDVTTGLVVTAASKTPVLKNIVSSNVHCGFWEAYIQVRGFIHAILRQELVKTPTSVFFTGHSLGGALATYAALDVSLHTVPRVNAYLKHKEKLRYRMMYGDSEFQNLTRGSTLLDSVRNTFNFNRKRDIESFRVNSLPAHSNSVPTGGTANTTGSGVNTLESLHFHSRSMPGTKDGFSAAAMDSGDEAGEGPPRLKFVKKIKIFMYNFGSPRVGNATFKQFYDKVVPRSYRIVVDGDIVTGLPPRSTYFHIGTEILIDSVGAGSIIIDPSFVERWLRTHLKSSVTVHSLLVYRKGLLGIKLAAEFMKDYLRQDSSRATMDPLKLALKVQAHAQVDTIIDENSGIAADLAKVESGKLKPPTAEEESKDGSDSEAEERKKDDPVSIELSHNNQKLPVDVRTESQDAYLSSSSTDRMITSNPLLGDGENLPINISKVDDTHSSRKERVESDVDRSSAQMREAKHYAQDVEHMEGLMKQITGLKGEGPVKWLKQKAFRQFRRKKRRPHETGVHDSDAENDSSNFKYKVRSKSHGSTLGKKTVVRSPSGSFKPFSSDTEDEEGGYQPGKGKFDPSENV